MQEEVEVGRVYKHFKGKYVFVLAIAKYYKNEETDVIYKGLNNNEVFARELNCFLETVEKDGQNVSRFSLVEDEEVVHLISKQELNNLRQLTKAIN